MKFHIVALVSLFLLSTGCAHKSVSKNSDPTALPVTANENTSEDQAIKKLPSTSSAADLPATGSVISQIPVEVNPEVEKWIEYFQGRGRGYFERYLERSTRYAPMMKKILSENGVPEDLIYIAMIESGFSGKIKSRAKAVGFWQFIGGTGKHYGLLVNRLMDERYDPVRSTEAAANYFKGLYNLFGNWYLAIASYNVGENRIKSMVMKNYTRDFWELARRKQLPAETMQYIPKFLAASLIAREPEKYGFTGLNYEAPMTFDTVTSKEALDMRVLAKAMKIDYEELRDLNFAYKTQYVPLLGETATLRVPQGTGEAARQVLAEAVVRNKRVLAQADAPISSTRKYRVRRGETLDSIATRFDVSVEDILKVNRIRHGKVRSGMTLKIPVSAETSLKDKKTYSKREKNSHEKRKVFYVVKKGDTLSGIAKKHNVTMSSLKKTNRVAVNGRVLRGQKLVIPQSPGRDS